MPLKHWPRYEIAQWVLPTLLLPMADTFATIKHNLSSYLKPLFGRKVQMPLWPGLRNREGLCAQSGPHSPLTNRQEEGSTLSVHTQIHETTQTPTPSHRALLTMDVQRFGNHPRICCRKSDLRPCMGATNSH